MLMQVARGAGSKIKAGGGCRGEGAGNAYQESSTRHKMDILQVRTRRSRKKHIGTSLDGYQQR